MQSVPFFVRPSWWLTVKLCVAAAALAGMIGIDISSATSASAACYGSTYVSGHTRSDGSYVSGHYRSCPDSSSSNNWSTYPNYNPYTGEQGTRRYPSYSSYDSYSTPGWSSRDSSSSWSSSWYWGR